MATWISCKPLKLSMSRNRKQTSLFPLKLSTHCNHLSAAAFLSTVSPKPETWCLPRVLFLLMLLFLSGTTKLSQMLHLFNPTADAGSHRLTPALLSESCKGVRPQPLCRDSLHIVPVQTSATHTLAAGFLQH